MLQKTIGVWLRNAALLLIIAAFIVFFGPQSGNSPGSSSVGTVNGETIDIITFAAIRDRYKEDEQRLRDQGMTAQVARDYVNDQVIKGLVQLYLRAQAAHAQGFRVSDAEVARTICARFSDASGRCPREYINAGIERQEGFAEERPYVEFLRRQILVYKMDQFLGQTVRISKAAARERQRLRLTKLKLRYLDVPIQPAAAAAQVSEDELEDFAERESARIAAEYDRRRSEFQKPEEVRARHILLTGDGAQEQAQKALERVKGGEDFAKVAAEVSKDVATAASGGDLNFFPRGRMPTEFESAAFAAPEKALIGPIQTQRGFHVIRVEEKRAAVNRSLEEVTPELARGLLARDRAQATARERAERLAAEMAKGKRLQEIAAAESLVVQETPEFASNEVRVPGMPPLPGLQGAALSLTLERPASEQVFAGDDGFYLIELAELKAPKPEEVEASVELGTLMLTQQAQEELLEEAFRRVREKAEQNGAIVLRPLGGRES
jgi:peptidyl-prolyl cis-trans isomerase D